MVEIAFKVAQRVAAAGGDGRGFDSQPVVGGGIVIAAAHGNFDRAAHSVIIVVIRVKIEFKGAGFFDLGAVRRNPFSFSVDSVAILIIDLDIVVEIAFKVAQRVAAAGGDGGGFDGQSVVGRSIVIIAVIAVAAPNLDRTDAAAGDGRFFDHSGVFHLRACTRGQYSTAGGKRGVRHRTAFRYGNARCG